MQEGCRNPTKRGLVTRVIVVGPITRAVVERQHFIEGQTSVAHDGGFCGSQIGRVSSFHTCGKNRVKIPTLSPIKIADRRPFTPSRTISQKRHRRVTVVGIRGIRTNIMRKNSRKARSIRPQL